MFPKRNKFIIEFNTLDKKYYEIRRSQGENEERRVI